MTTLREAAKQALTILEAWRHKGMWGDWDGVTDALKAALVEDALQKFTDVNQELMAALGCDHCNHPMYAAIKCRVCGRVTKPAPPQRKPLSEEEIMQCFDEAVADYVDVSDAEMVDFARAIERAHNIT